MSASDLHESMTNPAVRGQYLAAIRNRGKDVLINDVSEAMDLLISMSARLQDAQKRIAELENNETCQRLANAEHVIYMKDLAIHNILASRRAQFKKRLDAQKRIAELEANDRMNQQARDELLARAIEAEDELARRDAAKGEPVAWQFYDDGNWYNGVNNNGHRRNTEKAGYRVRDLYPAPQPATLPKELDNDSEFIDPYRAGYNKAISDARELGCKSAPIVELPPDYSHSPDFTEYHLGWNSRGNSDKEQLEAAGIKWKIID